MKKERIRVYWFRQDLRLSDHRALEDACRAGLKVVPLYLWDWESPKPFARMAYTFYALKELDRALGGNLTVVSGSWRKCFEGLCARYDVEGIYTSQVYEPWQRERDAQVEAFCHKKGLIFRSTDVGLLWSPEAIRTESGGVYKLFTAFYRRGCLRNSPEPQEPRGRIGYRGWLKDTGEHSLDLERLGEELGMARKAAPEGVELEAGEKRAQKKLEKFCEEALFSYGDRRDFPALSGCSDLSEHLMLGEIAPHRVWYRVKEAFEQLGAKERARASTSVDIFLSELGWREFSHYLMWHFPTINDENMRPAFNAFPWKKGIEGGAHGELGAWQRGETGYPLVDAGMRELLRTGKMHNRVRMVTASFLIKNLGIHWHYGRDWFWKHLRDADMASNSMNWQWVAGTGVDSSPFFRIFNPTLQAQKYDPDGAYIRMYIPELSALPDALLRTPWKSKERSTYPSPIVDLNASRTWALSAYARIRRLKEHPSNESKERE